MKRHRLITVLLVHLLLLGGSVAAVNGQGGQGNDQREQGIIANPTFNLSPPGARSLGMGAAFIGIADDATAAESNPAGLAALTQPEFSINLRTTSSDNQTVNPFASIFENTFKKTASFSDSTSGPSFVSYAHPWNEKGLVFSFYYQEAMNFRSHSEFSLEQTQAILQSQIGESQSQTDVLLEHLGFSAAFRLGPNISVGASVRYTRADLELTRQITLLSFGGGPGLAVIGTLEEGFDDVDEDITVNIGALVNPGGKFSLGLVYKQGADFNIDALASIGVSAPNGNFEPLEISGKEPVIFTVPDAYGGGIAYRPSAQWTIGLDVIRVLYSDTTTRIEDSGFSLSDETEVHFGLEYGFTLGAKNTPVFVRAGYYTNPDHDGTALIDSDQNFITAGVGVFLKNKLQLDAAVAISEDVTETLISMVWRL